MSRSSEPKSRLLHDIVHGTPLRTALAIFLGFLIGAIFMVGSNREFLGTLGNFFTRPQDAFISAWSVVGGGYGALFRGSIFTGDADSVLLAFRPFFETIRLSVPLIIGGLGLAVAFKTGLFNIGGTGQIVAGMAAAVFVATRLEISPVLHHITAIVAAVAAAGLWGWIVGFIRAKTGAHEVILTIMFNYIAIGLFTFMLRTPTLLKEAGDGTNPKADSPAESALFAPLFSDAVPLHWGLLLAPIALVVHWWLMERSSFGFRLRMVGLNPEAAKTSGIDVPNYQALALLVSATFMGLVAANQILGNTNGATANSHINIGFDAITVALLGGSSTIGVLFAGLLFGAFKAGSPQMQIAGISADVLTIVQASIVLFIAAPPLVRALFGLTRGSKKLSLRKTLKRQGEGKVDAND